MAGIRGKAWIRRRQIRSVSIIREKIIEMRTEIEFAEFLKKAGQSELLTREEIEKIMKD